MRCRSTIPPEPRFDVGDHDEDGVAAFNALADDVVAYGRDFGHSGLVTFERAAILLFQIIEYAVPQQTAPYTPGSAQ